MIATGGRRMDTMRAVQFPAAPPTAGAQEIIRLQRMLVLEHDEAATGHFVFEGVDDLGGGAVPQDRSIPLTCAPRGSRAMISPPNFSMVSTRDGSSGGCFETCLFNSNLLRSNQCKVLVSFSKVGWPESKASTLSCLTARPSPRSGLTIRVRVCLYLFTQGLVFRARTS